MLAPINIANLRFAVVDLLQFSRWVGRIEFVLEDKSEVTFHHFALIFREFGSPRYFKEALEPVTKFGCFHKFSFSSVIFKTL